MKHKKTFWRGFGAGVLFAAVILGISCLLRTSDAQAVASREENLVWSMKPLIATHWRLKSRRSGAKSNERAGTDGR